MASDQVLVNRVPDHVEASVGSMVLTPEMLSEAVAHGTPTR